MNETEYITPKMRDTIQYLKNLEYLHEVYGKTETEKMLREVDKN